MSNCRGLVKKIMTEQCNKIAYVTTNVKYFDVEKCLLYLRKINRYEILYFIDYITPSIKRCTNYTVYH